MNSSASTRTQRANGSSSLAGLSKVMARLLPRQVSDELSLALAEMKQKGIKAGVAAAFLVVALLFLAALGVALIAAAILGLATVMPAWLAALLVAALFLVIAAIAALVGVNRFKKTMPLLPEDALRGIRYDLGVLKEGRSFDPATLDAPKKPKEQKPEDGKQEKPEDAVQKPTPEELRIRLRQRREHIAAVRDGLGEKDRCQEADGGPQGPPCSRPPERHCRLRAPGRERAWRTKSVPCSVNASSPSRCWVPPCWPWGSCCAGSCENNALIRKAEGVQQ